HPVGHRRLCQYKTDKALEHHFRLLQFRKTRTRFYNTHNEEQHQQGAADGLERAVDTLQKLGEQFKKSNPNGDKK
ncbi:hypothetical protein, partial [uncultured Oscillibacter sp.]|uniref:hypothetical protein n=1 Tax=uncultured Oscillibacter sp. TaxID=876091 RepID=UPI002629527A